MPVEMAFCGALVCTKGLLALISRSQLQAIDIALHGQEPDAAIQRIAVTARCQGFDLGGRLRHEARKHALG